MHMNIGEKIKKLRTDKVMTQAELAGSEITRNMLSRIENGAAQPSLDTLKYVAKRLNVSPGFLLAEGDDEQMYIKYGEMHGIKNAYLNGDYRICREACLTSANYGDDEVQLILAECTLEIAIEEFCLGNLRAACEYFDLAIDACTGTVYHTEHVSDTAAMYFKYMGKISATLSSSFIDEGEAPTYASLSEPFCMYAGAFLMLDGDGRISGLDSLIDSESLYGLHIRARRYMREKNYAAACECLRKILFGEESIPSPMLYFVFCDAEICCRETEDFKGAYEYSTDKLSLLQRMLS